MAETGSSEADPLTDTIEQSGKFTKFFGALNKYKEIIALIVFLLGGISWIYGYFATKEQVRLVKCLMNTNIQLIQYQLQQKLAWDERREHESEHIRLGMIKDRTREGEISLSDILAKIEIATKKSEMAMNRVADAEHILQSNQCEEEKAPPPKPKE
jgi:hypothetical protein